MTQSNLYMDDDGLELYVDVQPLTLDELKSSRDAAVNAANNAQQSAESASSALTNITTCKTNLELFYAQASDNLRELLTNLTLELNNTKNIIVSTLQSLGNTILTNINIKFNQVKSQIETLGQNYVNQAKSYAEEAQITVDNRVSTEHLIQSNALKSGEISSDSEVLSWVTKMTHSTFDLSKFTLVGSPIITDNGIASGFSSSNYIKTPVKLGELKNKSWEMVSPIIKSSATDDNITVLQFMQTGYGDDGRIMWKPSTKTVDFRINTIDDTTPAIRGSHRILKTYTFSEFPQSFQIKFTFNIVTGTYNGYVKVNDGDWSLVQSFVPTTTNKQIYDIVYNENLYIYAGIGGSSEISFDLKYFSITVDGIPVFSGNQTGLDVIKLDDFTTVGSPSITFDGIASNYNKDNYIKCSQNFDTTKPWKIKFKFTTPTTRGLTNFIGTNNAAFLLVIDYNTFSVPIFKLQLGDGTTWTISGGTGGTSLVAGQEYYAELIYDGTKYIVNVSTDGINYTQNLVDNHSTPIGLFNFLTIGTWTVYGNSNTSSLDLNSFKVYANGDLVYQPCLKIPYTKSKTGSKIADVVYRDRIFDMYEQYGYSPYYTLKDTKKSNYQLVGNPVISGDYIASGFSKNDYIKLPVNLSNNANNIIKGSFIYKTAPNTLKSLWSAYSTAFGLFMVNNTIQFISNAQVIIDSGALTLGVNDNINYELYLSAAKQNLKIYQNGILLKDITSTAELTYSLSTLAIGTNNWYGNPSITNELLINLNAFKIYTGSKQVYEAVIQPNFTLPMGELYGMIERLSARIEQIAQA